MRLGITFVQKQAFALVLRLPFTIFEEYRMRLGITFVQKQAFALVLRSPFTIFAAIHF